MTAFGKRLIQSAQEVGAIARGEADPSTYQTHTPTDVDVRAIRAGQKLTQAAFAARYGFPIETLRGTLNRAGRGRTPQRGLTCW